MIRTGHLRRFLLVIFVGITLIGVGLLFTASSTSSPIYSIRQLDQGLRLHPHAWVGRTVSVRAIELTYSWGSGHGIVGGRQTLLIAPPYSSAFFTTLYGSRLTQINSPGLAPSLLLTGSKPPPSIGRSIALRLASMPVIGRMFGSGSATSPDVYRVQLVGNGPCPPVFSGFCPIGIGVS